MSAPTILQLFLKQFHLPKWLVRRINYSLQWRIYIVKFWTRARDSISFISMQFWAKFWPNDRLAPRLEILDPPLVCIEPEQFLNNLWKKSFSHSSITRKEACPDIFSPDIKYTNSFSFFGGSFCVLCPFSWLNNSFKFSPVHLTSGGFRGGAGGTPPGTQILSIHAVFRKIWQNRLLAPPPPPGSWCPPPPGEILDPPLLTINFSYIYRPLSEAGESYVFIGVCHSFCPMGGGGMGGVTSNASWDRSHGLGG